MYLGICIKVNNTYSFSKSFLMNTIDNKFYAQILRDVDYSLILDDKEEFTLYLLIYPQKTSYYDANKNPDLINSFKILGEYIMKVDNLLKNIHKYSLTKKLDELYELEINFGIIKYTNHNNDERYILNTPNISGNVEYLQNI